MASDRRRYCQKISGISAPDATMPSSSIRGILSKVVFARLHKTP
jgi:hypothetical protein